MNRNWPSGPSASTWSAARLGAQVPTVNIVQPSLVLYSTSGLAIIWDVQRSSPVKILCTALKHSMATMCRGFLAFTVQRTHPRYFPDPTSLGLKLWFAGVSAWSILFSLSLSLSLCLEVHDHHDPCTSARPPNSWT